MATRPELHIAVAKQKSKASDYNDNFDMMMDYCEAVSTEAKDYVDTTLAGNVFYRILGETIFSLIPLADSSVHLLDGSLINKSGIYSDFVDHMVDLAVSYPDCFCTEAEWQASVAQYGVCGKFVNGTTSIRLPKVTGFVEGTIDVSALGELVQAGLPNITGGVTTLGANLDSVSGAFGATDNSSKNRDDALDHYGYRKLSIDASRSSSIYGNSNTVQPQAIKGYYYIVVATATKTEIEVDIDEIAADLNDKADIDLANVQPDQDFIDSAMGWGIPDYTAGVSVGNPVSGSAFTAPSDGVYVFLGGTNNSTTYLYINGSQSAYGTHDSADGRADQCLTVPLAVGDIIYWSSSQGNVSTSTFYPLKGVSND